MRVFTVIPFTEEAVPPLTSLMVEGVQPTSNTRSANVEATLIGLHASLHVLTCTSFITICLLSSQPPYEISLSSSASHWFSYLERGSRHMQNPRRALCRSMRKHLKR